MSVDPRYGLDHHELAWQPGHLEIVCEHSYQRDACPGCIHDAAIATGAVREERERVSGTIVTALLGKVTDDDIRAVLAIVRSDA